MATKEVYDGLLSQIKALRGRAARFRRVALHIHSPDSHDWPKSVSGGPCDQAKNDRAAFIGADGHAAFLSKLRPHFDLAGITDHMKCGFACAVSEASRTDQDVTVLPGMEVNFVPEAGLGCARIHLVVLMPESTSMQAWARLFSGQADIPDDAKRTGQEEVKGVSLAEWVKRVHDEHGICIAAHVDSKAGVRCLFRQTSQKLLQLWTDDPRSGEEEHDVPAALARYLLTANLDAIEVAGFKDKAHYRWKSKADGSVRSIATLRTFDAHCLEDLDRPERLTHIKMTDVGLDGLREALKFPDTRVRFHEDVPPDPIPFIRGIKIEGTKDSFFRDLTLGFAENLNCLIGARGSGKSTVVEALRYVFGYNKTLDDISDVRPQIEKLQNFVLPGSLIRVVYRTASEEDHILEAVFDPKSDYTTKVYNSQGQPLHVADVEASGRYPLRLFGWSEIELLGRSPEKQRKLLDRLTLGIKEAIGRRTKARQDLAANRSKIEKVISDLNLSYETEKGEIRRFREYKTDFKKINTPEVKRLFSQLDLAKSKRALLDQLRRNAVRTIQELSRLATEPVVAGSSAFDGPQPSTPVDDPRAVDSHEAETRASLLLTDGVPELLKEGGDQLAEWWQTVSASLKVEGLETEVRALLRQAVAKLTSFREKTDGEISGLVSQVGKLEGELREAFSENANLQRTADLRKNAKARLDHTTQLRKTYMAYWESLRSLLSERQPITERLLSTQSEVSEIREARCKANQEKLNKLLPEELGVAIEAIPNGDAREYAEALQPFLKGVYQHKSRGLAQAVAEKWNPVAFASILRDSWVVKPGQPLSPKDAKRIQENTSPFAKDEDAVVTILVDGGKRLLAILKLEEAMWDDQLLIRLGGTPIDKVSPGQRSSAMLPLIALAETTPLVIDQPEDNLDKRLIGRALANVLAQLKEKRQIIVCTHDPNIVVGGDAEQVIVLEAESNRKGSVAENGHGSVDTPEIVKTIIDLLEGGKAAFEAREKRYGPVGVGLAPKG